MTPPGRQLRVEDFDEEEELTSEEEGAHENFYYLLESVYSYKLETGLEREAEVSVDESDSVDIFDALDSLKSKASEQETVASVATPVESSQKGTTEQVKAAEWTPEMEARYVTMKADLQKGKLKWSKLSNEKIKKIEKKVNWQKEKKLESELKGEIKDFQSQVIKAEHDLEKVANTAFKKLGNMIKFP